MYRLVSQAKFLKSFIEGTSFIYFFQDLKWEYIYILPKNGLFPFFFAINFLSAFLELKLYTQIYVLFDNIWYTIFDILLLLLKEFKDKLYVLNARNMKLNIGIVSCHSRTSVYFSMSESNIISQEKTLIDRNIWYIRVFEISSLKYKNCCWDFQLYKANLWLLRYWGLIRPALSPYIMLSNSVRLVNLYKLCMQ